MGRILRCRLRQLPGKQGKFKLIYRTYQPGDEVAIMASFNRAFGLNLGADYWRWKYLDRNGPFVMMAIDEEGIVQAHLAGQLLIWRGTETLYVLHVADAFCLPSEKNRHYKVMLKTLTAFHKRFGKDERVGLLYGFPSNRLSGLHGHYCPLATSHLPVTAFQLRVDSESQQESPDSNVHCASIKTASDYLPHVNKLWMNIRNRYALASARDGNWVVQRFMSRPDVNDYHFLGVWNEDGELAAWTVLRPVDDTLWLCDLVWDGQSPVHLQAISAEAEKIANTLGLPFSAIWLQGDRRAVSCLRNLKWQPLKHETTIAAHNYTSTAELQAIHAQLYITCADADLL